MMRRRRPTPEELRIWARVARSVTPLDGASPQDPSPPSSDPPAGRAGANPAPRKADEPRPATSTRRHPPRSGSAPAPPADRGGERRVRRGRVDFAARFDLHGHTQASADRALKSFLQGQQRGGARCVLVITGKGRGGESVLRRNFLHWLTTPEARRLVSGWSQAHARHGGHGAFYVFLRRPAG